MTLETGEGVPGSDSYASIAFADAYHAARGNAAWAQAPREAKEAALVRVSDYLDRVYGPSLAGCRVSPVQGRLWPRVGCRDREGRLREGVPYEVASAAAEGVVLEVSSPGILALSLSGNGEVLSEREGGISRSYARGSPSPERFPAIYGLMAVITGGTSMVRILHE